MSSNLSLSRRLLNQAAAASLQCCLLLCAILLSTQLHFGLMQISRHSYVHNDTWDGLAIIVSWHVSVLAVSAGLWLCCGFCPKSPENAATLPGMSGRGHLTEQTTSDTAEGDNYLQRRQDEIDEQRFDSPVRPSTAGWTRKAGRKDGRSGQAFALQLPR